MKVVFQGSGVFGEFNVAGDDVGVADELVDGAIFFARDVSGAVVGQEMD